jgi:hypothetical protein
MVEYKEITLFELLSKHPIAGKTFRWNIAQESKETRYEARFLDDLAFLVKEHSDKRILLSVEMVRILRICITAYKDWLNNTWRKEWKELEDLESYLNNLPEPNFSEKYLLELPKSSD